MYSYSPTFSQISLKKSFGKVVFQSLAKIEMTPNKNRLFGGHFETVEHFQIFFAELLFFITCTYMVQISLQNSGGKVVFLGVPWNPITPTSSMWLEHTNPLFQSLNTLKIQDLHSLQVGIFMYQFHHNLFPDDLLEPNYFIMNNEVHNYNTRGATNIRVGLVNTCLAYNTIRIQGALLWNSLPTSLKNASSINVFKRSYKKRCSWTITTHSYVLLSRVIFCCLLVLDYIYHFHSFV